MPTSTEEALRKFFTEERLKHYSYLHKQFPLWCGDWPEPECLEPEYAKWWSGGARLVAAWSEAFGGEIVGVDADSDSANRKYLIGPTRVEGPFALKDVKVPTDSTRHGEATRKAARG